MTSQPCGRGQNSCRNHIRQDVDGFIRMKTSESRPATKNHAGQLWTEDLLFHHLEFIERTVSITNEGAARLFMSPFLFRACDINSDRATVLSVDHGNPSVTVPDQKYNTTAGSIDWVSVVTSKKAARKIIREPQLLSLPMEGSTLLVIEAKGPNQLLQSHVPKAVREMHAFATTAKRNVVRGVLSNGYEWIFIILKIGRDGGGVYRQSKEICTHGLHPTEFTKVLSRDAVSLVSSILAHWMAHANNDLDDDDYFTY